MPGIKKKIAVYREIEVNAEDETLCGENCEQMNMFSLPDCRLQRGDETLIMKDDDFKRCSECLNAKEIIG